MNSLTDIVRFDPAPNDPWHPNSTPIYQTATFAQDSAVEFGRYDYSRSGNPTRTVLESQLARLEHAERAFAFASGMAALSTLARLVPSGGHVVAGDDSYGGTYRLLERVLPRCGVRATYADVTDPAAVAAAIEESTELVLLETPTNPLQEIADVRDIARLVRERSRLRERSRARESSGGRSRGGEILLAVDNSLLSPYLQNPLDLGADVVVHSATKHLCGHGDVTAGALAVRDAKLADEIAFLQNAQGTALGPFDSWLLLRGMKTLGVRLDRAQDNAGKIARRLARHPLVKHVHFPGLEEHPGHALHFRQARGSGSLVSFETGDADLSRRVVESLELFTISVSFGSVGSLASLPARMSHQSIPSSVRAERSLPDDLVRLSIGIEDARDLVADLERALEPPRITAARRSGARSATRSNARSGSEQR
jgi:cystathionine beta-lyase